MASLASSKPHPHLLDQAAASSLFFFICVLVEDNSFSKTLILNRPKQLNALSQQMVSRLFELFLAYEKDPNVKLLLLRGNGRAFCAGGNVAAVVRDIREGCLPFGNLLNWISSVMLRSRNTFQNVDDEEWEELKLPARFNLPGHAIAKL
ncbi:hypothetical protein NC652_033913 [Populus alba x Populus x berolinensis]|nr:hypothetical protein NC652_033913 [Populus alba x Populus x berolinensis]